MTRQMLIHAPVGPPVTGVTTASMAVCELVALKTGKSPKLINLTPFAGSRWLTIAKRAVSEVRSVAAVLGERDAVHVRVPSGNLGLLFDLLWSVPVRLSGAQVVLHHHSYSYLRAGWQQSAFRNLTRLLGSTAQHITLCGCMADQLQALIGSKNIRVLNNRGLLATEAIGTNAAALEKGNSVASASVMVGQLGWLSTEKGTDAVIGGVHQLRQQGIDARLQLAGYAEPEIVTLIDSCDSAWIAYLGPIDGEAKARFFGAIDVFVLPTRYANEAQPFVVYEANQAGAYVLATGRGCIADQLDDSTFGRLIAPEAEAVVAGLRSLTYDDTSAVARYQRADRWRAAAAADREAAERLLEDLLGPRPQSSSKAPLVSTEGSV